MRLIEGGPAAAGSVSRLELYHRMRFLSPFQIGLAIATKLVLLASVLYFLYR